MTAGSDPPSLTILLTTVGRPTLRATLASLRGQAWRPGDEVLLAHDGPAAPGTLALWEASGLPGRAVVLGGGPHGDWGHTPRNLLMEEARGEYVLHMDDDDAYAPGAIAAVRAALAASRGDLFLFRMRYGDGRVLWDGPELRLGNVSTQLFAHPAAAPLGTWGPFYGGDYQFIEETVRLNPGRTLRWVPEVIALIRPGTGADGVAPSGDAGTPVPSEGTLP